MECFDCDVFWFGLCSVYPRYMPHIYLMVDRLLFNQQIRQIRHKIGSSASEACQRLLTSNKHQYYWARGLQHIVHFPSPQRRTSPFSIRFYYSRLDSIF
jgi:coproporphyrinogen III oxidase